MADPTAPRRHQFPPDYPVDGNGNPLIGIIPGKVGHIQSFPMAMIATEAVNVLDGIVEALMALDPSADEEDVVAAAFPEKVMEITEWWLVNRTASVLFVGGPEAAFNFGVPCLVPSGFGFNDGTLKLRSDITSTYIWSPVTANVVITLIGGNFGSDSKPPPPSHLNPVHPSQNPDPVFVP